MSQIRHSISQQLTERMRRDWDARVLHDYRFWMSDGTESNEAMWQTGERDFQFVISQLPTEFVRESIALEIGCGVGRLLRAASKEFHQVVGVDISDVAIRQAQELLSDCPNVEVFAGKGDGLPEIPDESIDFVYSFASLSNMPVCVIASYLAEMSRVLRVGGKACIQLYLGSKQPTVEEDTLAIRVLDRNGVFQVLHDLGLRVAHFEELKLPFEVSDPENDATAFVLFLERQEHAPRYLSNLELLLVNGGESQQGSHFLGSETAYSMAITRARQHLEQGRRADAIDLLRYAVNNYLSPEPEVIAILRKLEQAESQSAAGRAPQVVAPVAPTKTSINGEPLSTDSSCFSVFFSENMSVLERAHPGTGLRSCDMSGITFRKTPSGDPTLSVNGSPLDNTERPRRGGEVWVERALSSLTSVPAEGTSVTVIGFAGGYHIEALLARGLRVRVLEPSNAVMSGALSMRDLRSVIGSLEELAVGEDECLRAIRERSGEGDLLIYPQTQLLFRSAVDQMKSAFWSGRGVSELRPSIAVVGPLYGGSLPIARYVADTLTSLKQRAAFYDVSSFFPAYNELSRFLKDPRRIDVIQSQYVEMLSQMVLESTEERPIDLLICLAQAPLSPRALMELRKRGTITAMWFVEDCRRFQSWRHLSQYFDYMFVIQQGEILQQIEEAGAGRAIYLPLAAHPGVHKPIRLTPEERKEWGSTYSFVGAGYHNRQQMFASLADRDFKIWGTEWPTAAPFDQLVQAEGRRLDPSEYLKIFSATDVNINLHSSTERDGVEPNGDFVNPRTFELAAAGAFQLVDRRTLLPELFDLETELVTFSDKQQLLSQLDYYAKHPDERSRFASRARERVLREHTYERRITQMLGAIYADRYQQLRTRMGAGPWPRVLDSSKEFPELRQRLEKIHERGEDPKLDHLVADIKQGEGTLTETEQKLMFLHHIRSQIAYIEGKRSGKS